jgi:hypothetical protein
MKQSTNGRTKSAHSKLSHPKFSIPLTVHTELTQHTANPILKARTVYEPEDHSNQTEVRKPHLRAAARATKCARWNQQTHKLNQRLLDTVQIRTANCTKLGSRKTIRSGAGTPERVNRENFTPHYAIGGEEVVGG